MDLREFVERLDRYELDAIPASEFEEWFEQQSWNVHQLGSRHLTDAVFRVESLLTAYDDDRLSEQNFRQQLKELANSIRPFVETQTVSIALAEPPVALDEPMPMAWPTVDRDEELEALLRKAQAVAPPKSSMSDSLLAA